MYPQNTNIQYLKKLLTDFGDIPCFSVLTIICDDFKVSNINENPEYISTAICSSLPAMSRGIEAIAKDKPIVFSEEQNICPYCKTPLILRKGKYGEFYGCTNFPKCRYTQKV